MASHKTLTGLALVLLLGCRGAGVPDHQAASIPPSRPTPTAAPHATSSPECSEPTVASRVLPEYPLYHMHLDGAYVFKVTVTADGHTESVQVINAANPG